MIEAQKLEWHTPTIVEMIIPEEWKPVVGFEGCYEVSNYGRVKNLARQVRHGNGMRLVNERILKFMIEETGRQAVNLCKSGKPINQRVHTLVLTAFDKPRPPGPQCRHLNGDPSDTRLINLCWGTHLENQEDKRRHGNLRQGENHWLTKLTKWQVLIDIPVMNARGLLQREIANELGISRTTFELILSGANWGHLYQTPPPVFTPEIEQKYVAIRGTMAKERVATALAEMAARFTSPHGDD
jgi:NUMOD4 motif-containing protein/HNH endonuclease